MAKDEKVLLVITAFTDVYISGYVNRFAGLWEHLSHSTYKNSVHLFCNHTFWNHFFKRTAEPNETVVAINRRFFSLTSRFYYPFYIVYVYKRYHCTSVHLAANALDWLLMIRVLKFFRIPHCLTFASNSVEMAGYNSPTWKAKLEKVLNEAEAVDILNPTHSLHHFKSRKFVSPCSFPYILESKNIKEELFVSSVRENTIVFCGSLIDQKNPLLAIEGFSTYLAAYPDSDAVLLYIGKGGLEDEIKSRARILEEKYGRICVRFENYSKLEAILSRSRIFLSLQDFDNYPSQSLMEGMLFCNHIISIDIGDTKLLVKENFNNILLKSKDASELAKAIHTLLQQPDINTLNRKYILDNFNVKKFAEYFMNIHRTIANG